MHYAEFAEDEVSFKSVRIHLHTSTNHDLQSQALLNAIKEYENNKWKVIGQKVGKPAKVETRPYNGMQVCPWLTIETGMRTVCERALPR